jgi:hypothetical protein
MRAKLMGLRTKASTDWFQSKAWRRAESCSEKKEGARTLAGAESLLSFTGAEVVEDFADLN